MSDFISDFMALTEGQFSPDIYRRWSAISLLAGAVERRIWVVTSDKTTFLNLYILLVGTPGTGKLVLETVRELWRETVEPGSLKPVFKVAPASMSKASLMDTLGRSTQTRLIPDGPFEYSALQIAAEEFSVLLPSYDMEYVGVLNSLYMGPYDYTEVRRASNVKELNIKAPIINIIAGTQPGFLASIFHEDAWTTGMSRRLMMVYSGDRTIYDIFQETEPKPALKQKILDRLGQISQIYGPLHYSPEAKEYFRKWNLAGGPPWPDHSKLEHWNKSRTMFIMKLAGISCVSRGMDMIISLDDIKRGMHWLMTMEKYLPDLFRAMVGKSDFQLMDQTHQHLMALYKKTEGQPFAESEIWIYLSDKAPTDKIQFIINAMEKGNLIARVAGRDELWIVRARHLPRVE